MMTDNELHEWAINQARHFITSEAKLLEPLEIVQHRRLWEKLAYTSLLQYTQEALGLSYDNASNFSRVARKCLEVPELHEAISQERFSVSTARRIVAVITPENADAWIDKASRLKQRELEKEIARENPRAGKPDRLKPLAANLLELNGTLSDEAAKVLERVQELESQRTGKPCSFDDAILAMGKLYLKKNDPMQKAERNIGKPIPKQDALRRRPVAQTQHAVMLKNDGQCAFVLPNGNRCTLRKWLSTHHHREWAKGGNHDLKNLSLLCHYHHKYVHSP
jgi:hypothetical protein